MSPASRSTMSPGTTSVEGISMRIPSRSTLALGDDMALRLSRDFSALRYCTEPRIALRISTAKMTMVLSTFSDSAEITAATIRIMTSKSLNCSAKTWIVLFFFPSESLLGPKRSFLRSASAEVSPSGDACCISSASWGVFA